MDRTLFYVTSTFDRVQEPVTGSAPALAGPGGSAISEPSAQAPHWGSGVLLAIGAGLVAVGVNRVVPFLTPTLVAIALGCVLAFSRSVPDAARPGLQVSSRRVLRIGVALLGLQLLASDVLGLGWPVLLVAASVVTVGIVGTIAIARWLKIDPELGVLIASGFSICGAAAVVAVQGVRRSRPEVTATAVSMVVLFGSAAMLVIPGLAAVLSLDPVSAGAWSGASIHEVGQVVVAGGLIGGAALQVAVVVKLVRVLMLAPVTMVFSWQARKEADQGQRPPLVPFFVLAFIGLILVRSTGLVPESLLSTAGFVQTVALSAGMFALGCSIDPTTIRKAGRPALALGAASTVLVALVALPAAFLIG